MYCLPVTLGDLFLWLQLCDPPLLSDYFAIVVTSIITPPTPRWRPAAVKILSQWRSYDIEAFARNRHYHCSSTRCPTMSRQRSRVMILHCVYFLIDVHRCNQRQLFFINNCAVEQKPDAAEFIIFRCDTLLTLLGTMRDVCGVTSVMTLVIIICGMHHILMCIDLVGFS